MGARARQRLLARTCCHCGLCAAVCPAGAIERPGPDPRPFLPRLDAEACVDCGLCERVCPTLRQPVTFAARQELSLIHISEPTRPY